MEENVVSGIGGVGWYGIISICIFFAFFTGTLIWVFLMKKSYVQAMEDLPLEDVAPDQDNPQTEPSHSDL